MTTELVLLLCMFAFITGPVFYGENGPIRVFQKSGPRLGARLEQQIATGRGFKIKGGTMKWTYPKSGGAPDGRFQ